MKLPYEINLQIFNFLNRGKTDTCAIIFKDWSKPALQLYFKYVYVGEGNVEAVKKLVLGRQKLLPCTITQRIPELKKKTSTLFVKYAEALSKNTVHYKTKEVVDDKEEKYHKRKRSKIIIGDEEDEHRCGVTGVFWRTLKKCEAESSLIAAAIDYYLTSQICSGYNNRTLKDAGNKEKSSIICEACNKIWQRNVNAARNMLAVASSIFKNKDVPAAFKRATASN
ncbi:hypothetical protein INT48_009102 [Thamnidium elegans]|uniref:F-box domain-containing protein n=1 Tax=Thamnidium elegans TaxID=101142 RepID=A0A8H7SML3_9FUNG|nr:hypothetical protein INT48_009102 [Thamnidium elegans]